MIGGQKRRSAAANLSAEESGESGSRHRVSHYTPHGSDRWRKKDVLSSQHRASRQKMWRRLEERPHTAISLSAGAIRVGVRP